jgi:hypothetical protein
MRKLSFGRKYKNQKFTIDGITFDSIREAHRYEDLKELQAAGIIQDLKLQVEFVLIPTQYAPSAGVYKSGKNKGKPKQGKVLERKCSYIADFVYRENGEIVVEDVKGMRTKDYVIKRKLMLYVHGIKIKEV